VRAQCPVFASAVAIMAHLPGSVRLGAARAVLGGPSHPVACSSRRTRPSPFLVRRSAWRRQCVRRWSDRTLTGTRLAEPDRRTATGAVPATCAARAPATKTYTHRVPPRDAS